MHPGLVLLCVLVSATLVFSITYIVVTASSSESSSHVVHKTHVVEHIVYVNTPAQAASVQSDQPGAGLASTATCPVSDMEQTLDAYRETIARKAAQLGTVTWSIYKLQPEAHAGKRVLLKASDFSTGTLRLRTSGVFVLTEDVLFEPNPDHDHFPNPVLQPEYSARAYVLGFFAAITIEANDIIVDLGGHSLNSTEVFALQQRFFATIELNSQPFVMGQGPANFGQDELVPARIFIENGILGRSSHHAIHGNAATWTVLQNLVFENYEVASVALNGCKHVVIRNVHARGTFSHIPVIGTYSNARFLKQFVARVLQHETVSLAKKSALSSAMQHLQHLMDQVLADVQVHGSINKLTHPEAHALFSNDYGLIDGNAYSLLIHPNGVAVGPFWGQATPDIDSPLSTHSIIVRDSIFDKTEGYIVEVVTVMAPNNSPIRGPAGDVLRLLDNAGKVKIFDDAGNYVGNALSNVQFALIDASLDVEASARKPYFGTTNGDAQAVAWYKGTLSLHELITQHGFRYIRNGDTMFHVNKGVIGIRIDGAHSVCLDHVQINNMTNVGRAGYTQPLPGEQDACEAEYTNGQDGGHPEQGLQFGYMGADIRGLSIAATNGVYARHVSINNIYSSLGIAYAVDTLNKAKTIHFCEGLSVDNVATLIDEPCLGIGNFTIGRKTGSAVGVHISGGSAGQVYGSTSIQVGKVLSGIFDNAHDHSVGANREDLLAARDPVNIYDF